MVEPEAGQGCLNFEATALCKGLNIDVYETRI